MSDNQCSFAVQPVVCNNTFGNTSIAVIVDAYYNSTAEGMRYHDTYIAE